MNKIIISTIFFFLLSMAFSLKTFAAVAINPDYKDKTEIAKETKKVLEVKKKKKGFFKRLVERFKRKKNRNLTISKDARSVFYTGVAAFFLQIAGWIAVGLGVNMILIFFLIFGSGIFAIGNLVVLSGVRKRIKNDKTGKSYTAEKALIMIGFLFSLMTFAIPFFLLLVLFLNA